ncbi:MAG: hypothetical protein SFW62_03510 [Alphaproteobacteria bacterium]|nr:hypothetical protein [Alphaproteobacteria bacterium]
MPSRPRRPPVSSDRRFRKRSTAPDYGPKERWQHSGRVLELTERAGVLAARATEEHIVDLLVLRGTLSAPQREAAMKFKLDYQRAGLAAHVTGSYSLTRHGRDFFRYERERSDFEEAAYQRWRNAVRELGLVLSGAVIATVCHDLLPTPRNALALQKGLDLLIDWYGLPKQ